MTRLTLLATLTLLLTFALPAHAGDHVQSGGHSDCLDSLVFWATPGVYSPNAQFITTTPGTSFSVETVPTSPLSVWIDFYDASGAWIRTNSGDANGIVPDRAVTGTICVSSPVAMVTQPDMGWRYTECDSAPCRF